MTGIREAFCILLVVWKTVLVGTDLVTAEDRTSPILTKYGKVEGFITRVGRDAAINKFVKVYLGVPYASPPTGNYRFAPTRPPTHWTGVLSATKPGPVCPQVLPSEAENRTRARLSLQSEDCLNLNIYVPHQAKGAERYPVMVFIHGDSYLWGSGNLYDGRVLAAYGKVVVVTINYRLGILGFLNTNTAPHQHPRMANYGLMDQIASLKWVQQNIEQFGGNPGSVTIFGHRTGAAAIHFLMESPASVTGLFHRAILMSGSGASPWSMVEDPVHYAVQLAANLNCTLPSNMLKNHLQIVDCLREKSLNEILGVALTPPDFLAAIGPSRDGVLIPSDFGLHSFQIKKRSANPTYQVMVGVSESEHLDLFNDAQMKSGISLHEKNRVLRNLARNCYDYHINEIFFSIENEYTDYFGDSPHRRLELTRAAVMDKLYISPVIETVNWANESGYQAFLYVHKVKEFEAEEGQGNFLSLVFGLPFAPEISESFPSTPRAIVSQTILTYWSNFAYTGNPNQPRTLEDLFTSKQTLPNWRRFTLHNQDYLELDLDPSSRMHYRPRTMAVWLKLIPKLHLSGSDHAFPDHSFHSRNRFRGGIDREGQAQPNLAYDSLQLGSGASCGNQTLAKNNNNTTSAVEMQERSVQPESTVLVVLSVGLVLLLANVWFWVCFVVRRRSIICCLTNDVERKKLSGELDLEVPQKPHAGHVYQRRVQGDGGVWYDSTENLSQSSSRFGPEEQTISLISNGHVSRTGHDIELYSCRASKTLPRDHNRSQRNSRSDIARACSQEQLVFTDGHKPSSSSSAAQAGGGASRSSLSRPHLPEPAATTRPKLSTFCQSEQGRSGKALIDLEVRTPGESGGRSHLEDRRKNSGDSIGRPHYAVQAVAARLESTERFLQPESV